MNRLTFILLVTIFFLGTVKGLANDPRIEIANTHYINNEFEAAVQIYEEILQSGMEAPEIYFNLGNAYYRLGNLPSAILNYERALLRAPHERDIRYNLDLANMQITDKINPVSRFFIARWFSSLRDSAKSNTWAWFSIMFFTCTLASIFIYLFARSVLIKKIFFFVATLTFISSLTAFSYSRSLKLEIVKRDTAIIFASSVSVRSAPHDSGTVLFVIHAGTKVKILQEVGEWREIEIADGNTGWIHSSQKELI